MSIGVKKAINRNLVFLAIGLVPKKCKKTKCEKLKGITQQLMNGTNGAEA